MSEISEISNLNDYNNTRFLDFTKKNNVGFVVDSLNDILQPKSMVEYRIL